MVLRKTFVLFAAFGVLAGCSSASTPEGTEPLHAAEELVEPLDREQTEAEEQFEKRAIEGEFDLAPKSSRLLRDDDAALYWVSRSPNGEICFTTELSPESADKMESEVEDAMSFSCASEAIFDDRGIASKITSNGVSVRTHLLPNNVSEESAAEVQEILNTEETENPRTSYPYLLVTTESTGLRDKDVTVERSPGGNIDFWTP